MLASMLSLLNVPEHSQTLPKDARSKCCNAKHTGTQYQSTYSCEKMNWIALQIPQRMQQSSFAQRRRARSQHWRTRRYRSAGPFRLGVSELMVHPVPLNSLFSQLPDSPNSACLRLPDYQILWILRFSERLIEPDYLYRGRSGRSRS